MNILLWVLQILLALHTIMGAVWKFSNPAQTVPSLNVIPHGIWMTMSVIELICGLALILPAFNKRLAILVPFSVIYIAAEMLFFCLLTIFSVKPDYNHIIYWLIVTAMCAIIAYGRFVRKAP
jgi:hypothetical protein